MPSSLEREMQKYKAELPRLLVQNEGKYVLIADDEIVGIYETYADAMNVGYQTRKLEPFLVKQIKEVDPVHYITRPVLPHVLAHR